MRSIALRTRGYLGVRGNSVASGKESLVSFTDHCARGVGAVEQAVNEKAENLMARARNDGTWHA
jgi:hypothetical protein